MPSTYDMIKNEHLNLLGTLARLATLFATIPHLTPKDTPGDRMGTTARGNITAKASESVRALQPHSAQQQAPGDTHVSLEATAPGVSIWPERPTTQALFKEFFEALEKHFFHEEQLLFTAMVMAVPTKSMCNWVFKRLNEHGQVREGTHQLFLLMEHVPSPLPRCWYTQIFDTFERIRGILLSHAVEEDTKFDAILHNNPEIGAQLRKLLTQMKTGL